jgi:hypothetical protein
MRSKFDLASDLPMSRRLNRLLYEYNLIIQTEAKLTMDPTSPYEHNMDNLTTRHKLTVRFIRK